MIDYKRKLIIYYFILKISIGVEVTIALVSRTSTVCTVDHSARWIYWYCKERATFSPLYHLKDNLMLTRKKSVLFL